MSQFQKTNRVVRLSFTGGLLGLLFGSSRGKVERAIQSQNAEGWNYVEAIPDQPNLAIFVLRLLFLICTLGLWTISTGYLFIFEKPRKLDNGSNQDEPRLPSFSAIRSQL